ncbi:hypothetical protein BaRGS_00032234 [Batillaria attramentaria]|uniref:Uncharacterized protein n=1 Tax=Batillaria attramentaria TaxID=370345 RepID=A0ABD0JNV8_9CAEN
MERTRLATTKELSEPYDFSLIQAGFLSDFSGRPFFLSDFYNRPFPFIAAAHASNTMKERKLADLLASCLTGHSNVDLC